MWFGNPYRESYFYIKRKSHLLMVKLKFFIPTHWFFLIIFKKIPWTDVFMYTLYVNHWMIYKVLMKAKVAGFY